MEAENAYEAARARRIAANKQQLAALGLANAAAQLGGPASGPIAGASVRPPRVHARGAQRVPEAPWLSAWRAACSA